MHIPWADAQLFLAVAETGSLSAAAKRLRVTQPTVSRRLQELEETIGEPLFVRSVEGAALTSLGKRMVEPVRRMAEEAGELERIAADLALRFDRPPQRDLVSLAQLVDPVVAFATRGYLATLPSRYTLTDVAWIGWPPALAHLPPNPQLAARIPGFQPVFASDDFLVQLGAAEAGAGAIVLGKTWGKRALPTALVPLALDFGKLASTTYLVCAKSSLAIARVRAVAELLAKDLAGDLR